MIETGRALCVLPVPTLAMLPVLTESPDVSDMLKALLACSESLWGCVGILERAESLTCLSFVHCLYSNLTAFKTEEGKEE